MGRGQENCIIKILTKTLAQYSGHSGVIADKMTWSGLGVV